MDVISRDRYRVMPWKNGGGTTTEIFVSQTMGGDFDWRVSIASVKSDGPFSVFTGIDRHIMLLEGNGMTLDVDGQGAVALQKLLPFSFSGDAHVTGTLADGPVKDFNLMVRHDFGTGTLRVQHNTDRHSIRGGIGRTLVHVLHGDSILLESGEIFGFEAGKTLIICEVSPHSRHGRGA